MSASELMNDSMNSIADDEISIQYTTFYRHSDLEENAVITHRLQVEELANRKESTRHFLPQSSLFPHRRRLLSGNFIRDKKNSKKDTYIKAFSILALICNILVAILNGGHLGVMIAVFAALNMIVGCMFFGILILVEHYGRRMHRKRRAINILTIE